MAITVHTTMATWLVEFATGGELGSDPGRAARQVWENIQSGQAMRGQVWEPTGHDPGWAARHVWQDTQAGPATMGGQVAGSRPITAGGRPAGLSSTRPK